MARSAPPGASGVTPCCEAFPTGASLTGKTGYSEAHCFTRLTMSQETPTGRFGKLGLHCVCSSHTHPSKIFLRLRPIIHCEGEVIVAFARNRAPGYSTW